MAQTKRIVVAEDHTILREGLKLLLSSYPDLDIVGEAQDGLEAIDLVRSLKPDLVLVDLTMPGMSGIGAIPEMKKQSPSTKVLVLTVHKNEEYILASMKAGADGYVLKDASHSELMLALESVLAGKPYLSPEISDRVMEGYSEGKRTIKTSTALETLTGREREILKKIAEGYRNREIAEQLSISIKTVEKHRQNLIGKLDLHDAPSLTAYAIKSGVLKK